MPDYQNGKIYTIRSHQTEDIYIGSTIQPLSIRFGEHKVQYKNYKVGKYHYVTSFKIMEHEDAYIELLENYPCDDRNELRRREGELIRQMKCVNERIAGRTMKEYYNENKQQIAEQTKEYRIENRQKIAERKKEYYNRNKQQIAERAKEYRIENRQKIAEQQKKYTEKNKQKILEYRYQKITCPCGSIHTRCNKSQHVKSKKHIKYIENIQNNPTEG
jgi:hypothetical protein